MYNYNATYYVSFNKESFDFDLMSLYEGEEEVSKFKELINSDLAKNLSQICSEKGLPIVLFCNDTIEHHSKLWENCSDKKTKLIVFSDNVRFDRQINFKEFEDLLDDYDFLHNEDYSIYLMSEKFCSYMNTVSKEENSLKELFSSLKHNLKQDLLILGDQKWQ